MRVFNKCFMDLKKILFEYRKKYINKSILLVYKINYWLNIDKKIHLPQLKIFGNRLQIQHPSHIHSIKDLIFRNICCVE